LSVLTALWLSGWITLREHVSALLTGRASSDDHDAVPPAPEVRMLDLRRARDTSPDRLRYLVALLLHYSRDRSGSPLSPRSRQTAARRPRFRTAYAVVKTPHILQSRGTPGCWSQSASIQHVPIRMLRLEGSRLR
jgi:hypothetical protein